MAMNPTRITVRPAGSSYPEDLIQPVAFDPNAAFDVVSQAGAGSGSTFDPNAPFEPAPAPAAYDTSLSPVEERDFQTWKAVNAPNDSGADYDLRGAFKAGVMPDARGHMPDTWKKPNHPTFSDQSQYAVGGDRAKAGTWNGETFTPAKGPKAATWKDYVGGAAGGFNKGVAMIPDAISALLNAGSSGLKNTTGIDLGRSVPFSEMLDKIGMTPKPPDTIAGRAIARVGEEFGAAALPSGALMKVAGQATKLGAHEVPGILNSILSPIARSPGRALTGEAIATAGAGAGAATAREAAPGSPTTEMLAQLGGSMAPAAWTMVSPTAWAIKGANKMAQTFSKTAQDKVGRDAVRDMLGRELTPEAMASLKEAERLGTAIPGFKPSVAEATGAQSLVRQQQRIETQASGNELDKLVARRRNNDQAVNDYTESVAPSAADNPDFVIDTARGRVDNLRSGLERQQAGVQASRENLAGNAFPVVDRAERGGVIRQQLHEERAARRAEADRLAEELGLNNTDVTAEFTSSARRLRTQFAPTSQFDDVANTPRVLEEIQRAGRPVPTGQVAADGTPIMEPARVTFRDLKGLRERVSDDLIDASGAANPSRKAIRQLTMLREEVDRIINRAAQNSSDPQLAERYAQFRRAYFDNYIRPFEQGAAYKVRSLDGRGFFKTTDEKVADAFFQKGNTTAADQFNEIMANRPEAHAALQSSAVDSLREAAVRDGVIDPRRFMTWLRDHRSVLDRFPNIAVELRTPALADTAYIRRQEQLASRARNVEESMLSRTLASYGRGATAESVIDGALKEPRKMAQLVGAVKRNDGAIAALRRNVWDRATDGDAMAITKFVDKNRASLSHIFSSEHLQNILNIASARAMITRVPSPQGAAYTHRPLAWLEDAIGQNLSTAASRLFAFKSGRVQKEYLIVDSFLRSLRGRSQISADKAFKAALFDPVIAKELAKSLEVGSISVVKAKKLQSRMIALGIPLLDKEDGAPGKKDEASAN